LKHHPGAAPANITEPRDAPYAAVNATRNRDALDALADELDRCAQQESCPDARAWRIVGQVLLDQAYLAFARLAEVERSHGIDCVLRAVEYSHAVRDV